MHLSRDNEILNWILLKKKISVRIFGTCFNFFFYIFYLKSIYEELKKGT